MGCFLFFCFVLIVYLFILEGGRRGAELGREGLGENPKQTPC